MQTSAKPVDQEIIDQIENQFYKALSQIKSETQMKAFLKAFLSETEQTVMHKRFAILKMLTDGKSYTAIEEQLKVSSATVSSISKLGQEPAIQELLKELAADEWATDMSSKFMEKFSFLKKKEKSTEKSETQTVVQTAPVEETPNTVTSSTSETPQTV